MGILLGPGGAFGRAADSLQDRLARRPTREILAAAQEAGDARRGAVVFFQPHLACSRCHATGEETRSGFGPDLASQMREVTDEQLVEALLWPSRRIRPEFASVTLSTRDGKALTGLITGRTETQIALRDPSRPGELLQVPLAELESEQASPVSLMPEGQVNQLAGEQQFYDLIRFLIEVRDGGSSRAAALRPPPQLLTYTLPEYESHLDHAGLIRDWGTESLRRGEALYGRVCANCHGTRDKPGSLPNSRRFADEPLKNGSDPYALYQTLTRGFGLMGPQTWMVPQQKYDVIHYLREAWLRPRNPSQYFHVDESYLAGLPPGDTRGPLPSSVDPWVAMDYGACLTHTYEIPGPAHNFAYKGVAVRLDLGAGGVSRGRQWMLFDTDTLRMAAAWRAVDDSPQRFIDWQSIQFDGRHGVHPHLVGPIACRNATGPGWADPRTGGFADEQRVLGRDGKRYGPLPAPWARYRGRYQDGPQVVFSYTVGTTEVLEWPRVLASAPPLPVASPLAAAPRQPVSDQPAGEPRFARTLNLGPRQVALRLRVADVAQPAVLEFHQLHAASVLVRPEVGAAPLLRAGFHPATAATWSLEEGRLCLDFAPGTEPLRVTVWTQRQAARGESREGDESPAPQDAEFLVEDAERDLSAVQRGGTPQWPQRLSSDALLGANEGPFAVDVLTLPEANPWLAQVRPTGLDFFPDGDRMALCTWDGDVWLIRGLKQLESPAEGTRAVPLHWQRIASGMFQPLGLKIVEQRIFVTCRDQLTELCDLNGDGETDFYRAFNNDHQVTEHFHEFAMGLQTDDAGNFYYAKSARHALPAVVPHHGTLLRVRSDGARTEILANGFRAANGVCLNPDGSFLVTDQEGHWNPKNRINWVTVAPVQDVAAGESSAPPAARPRFYGNMFGYHDVTDPSDDAMEPPLCWITNAFDRSPAELLWVDSQRWGPLQGRLLNLSYGYGKAFVVLHEQVGERRQGGMCELPLPLFPTGIMRGRFHPDDGQLYVCGMYSWAGNATQPGGLYRIRATGKPFYLPVEMHAAHRQLVLTFTEPLAAESVRSSAFALKAWDLKRTADYGSAHYNERNLPVEEAALSADGRTVTLVVPDLAPTWGLEVRFDARATSGVPVRGRIHGTIHRLSP